MKDSQQTITPTDGCAGRVDAMIPVVLDISVTASTLLGHRLKDESPQLREQNLQGRCEPMPRALVGPPVHYRLPKFVLTPGGWAHDPRILAEHGLPGLFLRLHLVKLL